MPSPTEPAAEAKPKPARGGKKLPSGSEWTFEALERYEKAIGREAKAFGLDTYPVQLEIISSEQMMDAYASAGMPTGYHHWSYGKHFIATEKRYKRGEMGLAYEIVINSNPCIAYLMEENTLTMQALVIAHAAYGHNSFFKGARTKPDEPPYGIKRPSTISTLRYRDIIRHGNSSFKKIFSWIMNR